MTTNITSDEWSDYCAVPLVTTLLDAAYVNGAVQPRLFSEDFL